MNSKKSTSTIRMARLRTKQKLQKQFDDLQVELAKIPIAKRYRTPQYRKLANLWSKINPSAPASTEKPQSLRISSADATLRGVFHSNINSHNFTPNDGLKRSGDTLKTTAGQLAEGGVTRFGVLSNAPADQGARSSCPDWLLNHRLLDKVASKMLVEAVAKHPRTRTVVSKHGRTVYKLDRDEKKIAASAVDIALKMLKCYFIERMEFEDPQVLRGMPLKVHNGVAKGASRAAQRYIAKIVEDGYRLLGTQPPTGKEREAKREAKEAAVEKVVERAQLGKGTDPRSFERADEDGDVAKFKNKDVSKEINQEFGRLHREDETRAKSLPPAFYPDARLDGEGYIDLICLRMPAELLRLSLIGRLLGKLTKKARDARKRK